MTAQPSFDMCFHRLHYGRVGCGPMLLRHSTPSMDVMQARLSYCKYLVELPR